MKPILTLSLLALFLGARLAAAESNTLSSAEKSSGWQLEQALIQALTARYPQRVAIEDQSGWDRAFTNEMRKVFGSFYGKERLADRGDSGVAARVVVRRVFSGWL